MVNLIHPPLNLFHYFLVLIEIFLNLLDQMGGLSNQLLQKDGKFATHWCNVAFILENLEVIVVFIERNDFLSELLSQRLYLLIKFKGRHLCDIFLIFILVVWVNDSLNFLEYRSGLLLGLHWVHIHINLLLLNALEFLKFFPVMNPVFLLIIDYLF